MRLKTLIATTLMFLLFQLNGIAQTDTSTYHLTMKQELVNKAGKETMGMTVNGGIPGPTIRFKEGGYAVIYVKNEMDVETSVHWHGLLLPNFYDGVPYLNTPPIMPGETQKYEFPLKQAGTYWYHSHTMLQEQSGVYGSIIIDPKEETLTYDKELVMVLSDWTNQKPMNVLRNLKRGNEWYNIKKGTATPLNQVIARGGLGAQFNFWKQRMESADIADIYYPAFLNNGEEVQEYPQFEPGDKVRLRIINGAASSQFWMTFGGADPMLVAADGLNVVPVKHNKTFIAIAETYDFIVTIPEEGKIEFRAMAQDGSGYSTAYLGQGEILPAPVVERPDKIGMMMQMAKMNMRMGAPAMKFNPSNEEPQQMMNNWGMQMDGKMNMNGMDHSKMKHVKNEEKSEKKEMNGKMDADIEDMDQSQMAGEDQMAGMSMFSKYNYNYLKSPKKTDFVDDKPVKDVLLNLTGNMWRYIWSMNGVPLSEADKIKINDDEVTRITFNNLTMMHHPMHLHGHFFRVINENGDYSPLKHTVNVPPMQKVVIEFDGSESGDWFFHCHILYHLMSGMARVVTYDTPRDPRMKEYPVSKLVDETNMFYSWGMADVASQMTGLNLVSSNTRNQFNLNAEVGYNENMEAEFTYQRYLYDYFSVFAGVNVENEIENSLEELAPTAILGFRFFTPYMFNLDMRIDNQARPEIRISRSIMIFPKTVIFGNYEYQADFGWVNDLTEEGTNAPIDYRGETTWSAGVEYFLNRNFSLMASYDNRFGAGGGLSVRF
jgi:CopA family copper-resistance protein